MNKLFLLKVNINKVIILIMSFFVLSIFFGYSQEHKWNTIPYHLKGYEKSYKESAKKAAIEWFTDARFGLFVHWGPATLYKEGEWVMYNRKIPVKEYELNTRKFIGERFNAQDYVDLAVKAQMKYITFVVKHHDGFSLWNSKATDYDSMDYPSHRDFLKELSSACQKAGIGLFIYYSIGIDWHHPYFMSNDYYNPARPHYTQEPDEYKFKEKKDFVHYMNFVKAQISELCINYGAIAGFWFDTIGGIYQHPDMFSIQEIYDLIHGIQPHALVVFKTGANGNEDFITGERNMGSLAPLFKNAGLPQSVQDAADESWYKNMNKPAELNIPIQTIGWAYHDNPKQHQKNEEEVWQLLEYCAQINANLLLNIGPRPDGYILEENIETLKRIGKKIAKYGFPKRNLDDYMIRRSQAVQTEEKIKENRTAN